MKKHWKIAIKYDTIIFHSKLSGGVCLVWGYLKKSSPFGCWPLSLLRETISFILVAFNKERRVKMIVLASRNGVKNLKTALIYVCILDFRNKIRKTLPSPFGLTDLSDYLLLYQILALCWLVLKHPYFVLQPYCPLLTIAVAPKFHSGPSLIFVFPSVIHTKTLKNILKK